MSALVRRMLIGSGLGASVLAAVWYYQEERLADIAARGEAAAELQLGGDPHGRIVRGTERVAQILDYRYGTPEWHDAQRLKNGCYVLCDAYDTGNAIEIKGDETQLSKPATSDFTAWTTVAYFLSAPNDPFDDFGLEEGTGEDALVHELQLKWSDARFEAQTKSPTGTITSLEVHRVVDDWTKLAPPVARFYWDEKGKNRHLVGLKCAEGWCFIGKDAQDAKIPTWDNGGAKARCTSKDKSRCAVGFGRHDEQRLMNPDDPRKYAGSWGLVIPRDGLESDVVTDFNGQFKEVATMRIFGKNYQKVSGSAPKAKLPSNAMITLSVRYSSAGAGGSRVWEGQLKIDGDDGMTSTRAVTVHWQGPTDPLAKVPGVASWRWDPGDEGLWVRCGAGCCKVTF